MENRFTVEILPTSEVPNNRSREAQKLTQALNNPAHLQHGLEGIYDTKVGTVIVWRTA
jgi:hypothetical protein